MQSRINVRRLPYGAKGNGKHDDTEAFRKALNAAKSAGSVVEVPSGQYRLTGNLDIPANVTLEGTLSTPPFYRSIESIPKCTSTLLADFPGGESDGQPFLDLHGPNSVVKGLVICYPQQSDPAHIMEYPWTIGDREDGSNNAVIDVFLLNAYQGVNFSKGSRRHTIRRLTGQALYRGIQIDRCTDVGRIVDVHFWPFWSSKEDGAVQSMAQDGVALILKGSDWQIVDNFFAFGYHTGIRFEKSDFRDPRTGKKKSANGQLSNLNLDSIGIGLDVVSVKSQGIQVSNANIALGKFAHLYPSPRHAIRSKPENKGSLVVRGLSVWGRYEEIVAWNSAGHLMLSSSVLGGRGENTEKVSAIKLTRGSAAIQGNSFTSRFKAAVEIGADAEDVLVSTNHLFGNTIRGDENREGVIVKDNL